LVNVATSQRSNSGAAEAQVRTAKRDRSPTPTVGALYGLGGRFAPSPSCKTSALRLSFYFGTSPELWLNLQNSFDLAVTRLESADKIAREVIPASQHAG